MGHKRLIIILFTALLAAVGLLCGLAGEESEAPTAPKSSLNIALEIQCSEGSERIKLWEDGQGNAYAFLPEPVTPEQIVFQLPAGSRVTLDGNPLVTGEIGETLCFDRSYLLEAAGERYTLSFVSVGSMPTMYVDVTSGSMDYIHMDKENEERGKLRLYREDGLLSYSGMLRSVKGRGNATWEWEKKPYGLTLMQDADLLGMGAAKHWVLLSNVYDDSHIRNKTVYDTAAAFGLSYSPDSRWVNLYLNGEYAGLYLLCEKIELHPQRVNLEGGSLISLEKRDRLWQYEENQFLTDGDIPVRIRETSDPTALKEKINTLERAILAPDGIDPVTGRSWLELIDLDSWARKYLVEEVFGNLDAGSISQFFYWEDMEDRVYAGPVWDYDVSMGNPKSWQTRDVNTLFAQRPHLWNPEDTPWFYALFQKEAFRETVMRLYEQELRPLLTELLRSGMADSGVLVSQGAAANALRWQTEDPGQSLNRILEFMEERLAFLDGLWLRREDYRLVSVFINWHVMACYAVPEGGTVPYREVPGDWDTIHYVGWYNASDDTPFDFDTPIREDTLIYLKEEDAAEASGISLGGKVLYVPAAALLLLLGTLLGLEGLRSRKDRRQYAKAGK